MNRIPVRYGGCKTATAPPTTRPSASYILYVFHRPCGRNSQVIITIIIIMVVATTTTTTTTMKYKGTASTNRTILQAVNTNADHRVLVVVEPPIPTATIQSSFDHHIPFTDTTTATTRSGNQIINEHTDLQHAAFDALQCILLEGKQNRGSTTTTTTSSSTTSSTDIDDDTTATRSIRTFLNLFGAACSNQHVPTLLLPPRRSMKEQHTAMYTALRNHPRTIGTLQNASSISLYHTTKDMFHSLHHLIQYVISNYIRSNVSMETDGDSSFSHTTHAAPQQQLLKEGYLFLHYATLCVTAFFDGLVTHHQHQHPQPRSGKSNHHHSIVLDVFHIAETLHDFLECIPDESSTEEANRTLQTIISLCEQWWVHDGYDKESIVRNILPTLLGNVVGVTDPKSIDIKRLYQLRTALSIIDLDDPESHSFTSLLLRITSSPACLRHPEGKQIIAYLLSDPAFGTGLRHQIHQSIRVQIPNNQSSIVLHYSDIYYLAWKDVCHSSTSSTSSGTNDDGATARSVFEMDVLSDFIYASIYAEESTLVSSMHTLLSKWYNYHPMMKHTASSINIKNTHHTTNNSSRSDDRAQFLYRMYTPILWRATVAPNPMVRINAVQTLLYLFPLSSSDTHQSHMTKVCTTIQQLLQDPDIKVRCTTTQVTTQLLLLYWDGIPTRYIQMILNGTCVNRFPMCVNVCCWHTKEKTITS